jgi:hypothetical protein
MKMWTPLSFSSKINKIEWGRGIKGCKSIIGGSKGCEKHALSKVEEAFCTDTKMWQLEAEFVTLENLRKSSEPIRWKNTHVRLIRPSFDRAPTRKWLGDILSYKKTPLQSFIRPYLRRCPTPSEAAPEYIPKLQTRTNNNDKRIVADLGDLGVAF